MELYIDPLGEVSHSAVDTADYGPEFPVGFLMHFGSAVELRYAAALFEASFEVFCFVLREQFLVGFDEPSEALFRGMKTLESSCLSEATVGFGVKQVVLEAAFFVGRALEDRGSKVLVGG